MILKSSNTRYVTLIRKVTVMGIGLLLAVGSLLSPTRLCAGATGFNGHPAEADNSLPALQSAAAITYLKEHKLYDSLRAALNAARTPQGDYEVAIPDFFNEQNLTASDGAAGDQFGLSVAISGSTIIVGSWLDDINGNVDQGSVYIFNRQGGSWVEEQKLLASDAAVGDKLGWSLASSGSILVVATIGVNAEGSVYVFNRQGRSWVEEQRLIASDAAADKHFGHSVAVSGSTIVAGSAITNIFFEGSAYVFNRQGGSWVETQKLTASNGAGGNIFGWSVAMSGSTIVVGTWGDTVGSNLEQGSAYVFNRQGGRWVEAQKLTASDGAAFDEFGWSVAISDSTIVVSAELQAIGGNTTQGFAYVYNRRGGIWVEEQKLSASDGEPHDRFGWSIAASGPTFVLGALGDNSFQGSAYVFGP